MGIKVFGPATIANLAVGFDILGVSLDTPGDDIIIKKGKEKGLKITKIRGGKSLPTDIMKNTAGYAAYRLMEHLGDTEIPLEMEIHKNMPFGSGMGSSAASAVAGAMAVNEILGRPLEKKALLPFAVAGEELVSGGLHLDNVAPSLLGGITLINDTELMEVTRIYAPKGLIFLLIHPHIKILTSESRSKLKQMIPMPAVIKQTANIAGFIAGCYTSNFDLIQKSLTDHLIEDQRSGGIPLFREMKNLALRHGALGFSISGSGPAMFALCRNSRDLENIKDAAHRLYADHKIAMNTYISKINHEGAFKY